MAHPAPEAPTGRHSRPRHSPISSLLRTTYSYIMPQSLSNLLVHAVFSTKLREPLLSSDLRVRLDPYMGGISRELNCPVLAIGGVEDHTHLLVALHPTTALADWIRVIKSNSSKWIHETFPDRRNFAWQSGYGAFAVSASNRDDVVDYIRRQPEHHRTRTFQSVPGLAPRAFILGPRWGRRSSASRRSVAPGLTHRPTGREEVSLSRQPRVWPRRHQAPTDRHTPEPPAR